MSCGCDSCGSIPGGPAGSDGLNAFTKTTLDFTQPAVNSNVTVTVSAAGQYSAEWARPTQRIYIEGGGMYEVVTYISATSIEVKNLGGTGNVAPAATVTAGGYFGPSGRDGSTGTNGADGNDGVAVIDYTVVGDKHTGNTSWGEVYNESVPADTLEVDEEFLGLEFDLHGTFDGTAAGAGDYAYQVKLGGVVIAAQDPSVQLPLMPWGFHNNAGKWCGLSLMMDIIRVGTDKLRVRSRIVGISGGIDPTSSGSHFANIISYEKNKGFNRQNIVGAEISGFDFTIANDLTIELKTTDATRVLYCTPVKLYKAKK